MKTYCRPAPHNHYPYPLASIAKCSIKIMPVFILMSLLAGCTHLKISPYSKSVNTQTAETKNKTCVTKILFPYELEEKTQKFKIYKPLMDALETEGLVKPTIESRTINRFIRFKYKATFYAYHLTNKGKGMYRNRKLCFGANIAKK